jgi:hypothetical protein
MISNSTSSAISIPSPEINIEFPQKIIENYTPIETMPTINISRRLALRKELHNRL